MDKGTEIYQELIDSLVKLSRSCIGANCVMQGEVRGSDSESGINDVLAKLSEKEREHLAEYVLSTYSAGIYDTLEQLEWLRECKDMIITVQGEVLPIDKFEGIPCDYIGRRSNWEWTEE